MDPSERDALEREIKHRCEAADFAGATAAAIAGYGPEIFGFVLTFARSEADASDIFSTFGERVFRGLPAFAWSSSFRTWAYTIARNASRTHNAELKRRAARFVPLPSDSELSGIAEAARTVTQSFLKTSNKERVASLRDRLPEADRMLLSLRLDRKLSWVELAEVLESGDGQPPSRDELLRIAARLRKRFQSIKEKLVEMGTREGLLERRPPSTK